MQQAAAGIPRSVGSLKRFPWPSARTLSAAIAAIAFFFLTVPLLAMLLRARRPDGGACSVSRSVASAAAPGLGTTAISLALILCFGTPLAYVLALQLPVERLVNGLVELPIILPPVVAGFGLLMAFGRQAVSGRCWSNWVSLPFTAAAVVVGLLSPRRCTSPARSVSAPLRPGRSSQYRRRDDGHDLPLCGPAAERRAAGRSGPELGAGVGRVGATILCGQLAGRTQTMPLLSLRGAGAQPQQTLWSGLLLIALALGSLLLVRWLTRSLETDPMIES